MREKKPINALKNHTKTDGLSILTESGLKENGAFGKIEDGCSRFDYCMVPYARQGSAQSLLEIKKEL